MPAMTQPDQPDHFEEPSEPTVDPYFFQAEATLGADSACYIERAADAALLKALRERKFAIMLSSRKVGKSSLLEHAFARLQQEGVLVAKKELAEGGATVTEEGWYAGLILELVNDALQRNGFVVKDDWRTWWDAAGKIPPGQRFSDFLRTYFLEPSSAPWVIALDEIDTTIPLPFSDDFFASVRRCQNARAADPLFKRLTFLLAGVASPAQLIKDNRRTPFNIGHAVKLTDFSAAEASVLLRGLGLAEDGAHPLLQRVLHWTGGHPYLTQRIFRQVAEALEPGAPPQDAAAWERRVDAAVGAAFLHADARTTEAHFHDIAHRRIGALRGAAKRRTLAQYRLALNNKTVADDALAAPIVELKLCGLLVCDPDDAARLVVRNRIYRQVFDAQWVRAETPRNPWQAGVAASAMVAVLALGGVFWQAGQNEGARIVALSAQIERADADVPSVAFAELKAIKGQEGLADRLMGRYWANKARLASVGRPRDEAALLWLKALSVDETAETSLQARNALAGGLGRVAVTLRHQGGVWDAVFSPDGRRVLSASAFNAQLWDAANGQPVGRAMLHEAGINHVAFSPDGRRALTASNDKTAQLWDAEGGQLGVPIQHQQAVRDAVFSPDGLRVLTASDDKTARLWNAGSGQPLGVPMAHQGKVWYAAFSPDGRRALTASSDNSMRLWDAESGQPQGAPMRHQDEVNHAVFSPDGRRVLSASDDKTARLWDANSGQPLGTPMRHQDAVNHAVFSPDGRRVVSASDDNSARLWDADNGQPLGKAMLHHGSVGYVVFSPDGRRVLSASGDNTARLWGANSGQPQGQAMQHEGWVWRAVFSPDGRRVLTASLDGSARLWDTENGQPLGKSMHQQERIVQAAFSPNGRRFAAISANNSAQLWDSASVQPLGQAMPHQGEILHVGFSPDGRRVVTASADKSAQIWDAESGKPLGKPMQHQDTVNSASFSPDGLRLVTASADNTVRLWDATSGQPLGKPMPHQDQVKHASFSPDGRLLITSSGKPYSVGGTVQLWDAETGQPLGKPMVHQRRANYAAFSPDGRRLVSASDDRTVRLWDAATGQPLGKPIIHKSAVNYAAFSPDGQRLLTSTEQTLNWFVPLPNNAWRLEATRWANGGRWFSTPQASDPSASQVRIADAWSGDTLLIRDLSPLPTAEPGLPELVGKPADLLARYQRTFALRFVDENKSPNLIPSYPMNIPK